MNTLRYIFVSLFLSFVFFASADELPSRPQPQRLVNDLANVLSPEQAAMLERKLVAYNDSTSTQIAVVIVSDLAGYDISDFTDRLAMQWGVGQKGVNNGLMILVKPKSGSERGFARISVGYGLEEKVTDVLSNHIINKIMIPHFAQNDYYGGIDQAVDAVVQICAGTFKAGKMKKERGASWIFFLIPLFLIFFVSFFRRNRYNHIDSGGATVGGAPFIFFPGFFGGGGGGDSSGGFFDGGGGFGGFGGGDFGGGGSSGSW
jgi:uncharacterized protein